VDRVLSPEEPRIKEDLIRLIAQYLNEEGYQASKLTLLDECNLKSRERDERQLDFLRLRKAILGGIFHIGISKLMQNPSSLFLFERRRLGGSGSAVSQAPREEPQVLSLRHLPNSVFRVH
jgi:hypothetical protein